MHREKSTRWFTTILSRRTWGESVGLVLLASLCPAIAHASGERPMQAVPVARFLDSLGVNTHVQHGQDAAKLAKSVRYLGVRNIRDAADGRYDMSSLLLLHAMSGALIDLSPGSGVKDKDFGAIIEAWKQLAAAHALRSMEGPNEPNNFGGVVYKGVKGGSNATWQPVANFQRDLYRTVKADATLREYPLLNLSESGAETNNVGLQFLLVPKGSGTLTPDGTVFADLANCHNYVAYAGHKALEDNMAWKAADPVLADAPWDGLVNNYNTTWGKHFHGYSLPELRTLPRVTTETGWKTGPGDLTEEQQAKLYLDIYLSQFKQGWKYTYIYELADDSDGAWGFFKADLTTPRKAAVYLHNLTSILADPPADAGAAARNDSLPYALANQPATVHDLLLEKSDGTFELVLWNEQVHGTSPVQLHLAPGISKVKLYDTTQAPTRARTLGTASPSNPSLRLTLTDHPVVLEFTR
ncbi:glycosyl hydrolase [Acidipila sp. EB88]|uniref:glycosyl hydrolase n=1 Tax=Acidipila sp. EB88 TaxID=2305226 RepID=UPI000F5F8ACF|nr:glycosyl hydrolase [Acidipila sp. EB88]